MKTDIAIIGGGPGGSAAAMFLSPIGLRITIIEKAQSPRYHIGESLTGECGNCLRTLGLEEEMTSGFRSKDGIRSRAFSIPIHGQCGGVILTTCYSRALRRAVSR